MRSEFNSEILICGILSRMKEKSGMDHVSSVILSGSFGRNEATYTYDENGIQRLISDVEIVVTFPKLSDKPAIKRMIREMSSEFEEDINLMPLSEHRIKKVQNYNFALVTPVYKTLFTFDLYNGSKTI